MSERSDGWGLLDEPVPAVSAAGTEDLDTAVAPSSAGAESDRLTAAAEPATLPDTHALRAAGAALSLAAERLAAAAGAYEFASDGYDDAVGACAVAEAKVATFTSSEDLAEWQLVAAHEDLATTKRAQARAHARAERARAELEAAERAHRAAAAHLQAELEEPTPDPEPELCYATADDFVREWLVPTYRRAIEGNHANGGTNFVWSAEWWRHPEAMVRLDALWRAFEHLRRDPALGMSVFLRDHADHHVPILLSKFGPFRHSTDVVRDNGQPRPLPYKPPPPGLFKPVEATDSPVSPEASAS